MGLPTSERRSSHHASGQVTQRRRGELETKGLRVPPTAELGRQHYQPSKDIFWMIQAHANDRQVVRIR